MVSPTHKLNNDNTTLSVTTQVVWLPTIAITAQNTATKKLKVELFILKTKPRNSDHFLNVFVSVQKLLFQFITTSARTAHSASFGNFGFGQIGC